MLAIRLSILHFIFTYSRDYPESYCFESNNYRSAEVAETSIMCVSLTKIKFYLKKRKKKKAAALLFHY